MKGDRNTPGVDIVAEKRAARQRTQAAEIAAAAPTFQQCAEKYIDAQWSGWSEKHRAQWPASLKRYAYPTIGGLTIADIRPSHIYDLLAPIWIEKRETANRVRGRIETIIAKNTDINDLDFRNPAELTKQLREKLPKRPKRTVRHHPALALCLRCSRIRRLRPGGNRAQRHDIETDIGSALHVAVAAEDVGAAVADAAISNRKNSTFILPTYTQFKTSGSRTASNGSLH
ncbi:MAG: hypothetical protein Q8L13_20420 [Bradyrhizobium sp.]|nr:hypothetical protein [Bradyrhizobium sp.]MDP1868687.1 hypothetical protein [Bradyrhizobium sp.]